MRPSPLVLILRAHRHAGDAAFKCQGAVDVGLGVEDEAAAALLDELVDFFPSRRRAILRQIVDKMKQADELILGNAEKAIESGEFDAALKAAISGGRSGSSPASSGSPTPAP